MASGFKELQINTQERAVSVDINRLQKFKSADTAEVFRYLMNVQGSTAGMAVNDDLDAGAVITEPNALGTPLLAEIIGGLLVRPQPGTLNLLVDPGVMCALAPDAAADDSNYKYVRDPGVTVAGTLVVTTNGAGSNRIDVVEVQVGTVVSETDSRDIFSPTTGLFTATSVTKARQHSLTYRVRAGTPGSGYPGNVSGWLPLAVIYAPPGAATVDAMDFWDVRPLTNDRVHAPYNIGASRMTIRKMMMNGLTPASVIGWIEAEYPTLIGGSNTGVLGGRRVGGRLRSGQVLADSDVFDATATNNKESGFTSPGSKPYYLYLCFPFGLPRWARYTRSAPRVPRSPRGIPIISGTLPDADGNNSSNITMVGGVTGLPGVVSAGQAICIASPYSNAGSIFVFPTGDLDFGFTIDSTNAFFGATGVTGTSPVFTGTANTHFPAQARSLLISFEVTVTVTGTTTGISIFNPTYSIGQPGGGGGANAGYGSMQSEVFTGATNANTFTMKWSVWVPIVLLYQLGTGSPPIGNYTAVLGLVLNPTNITATYATSARILAYKI